jgi:hypothetical protein
VSKSDPKNDLTTRKIDKELDQQIEPKEMPDSAVSKTEANKSSRRER